jgi:SAM-dependent MidA family methyltransferase
VNELRRKIEHEIRERGPIPFSQYIEMCLYDPKFGYYSRNAGQFGKAGDFYTSSDVHAVFGRLLSRQFEEMWRALGSPEPIVIREFGPGRGLFAQDVMDWSEKKFSEFFRVLRYELVEQSTALRERIEQTLSRRFEAGKAAFAGHKHPHFSRTERVRNGVPKEPRAQNAPTIVFANEFFDAIPVDVISSRGSLRIDSRDARFVETWASASAEELEFLDRYSVHPEEGERVEVSHRAQKEMGLACDFETGFVVVIDYGYTRDEQLAGRHRGTVKAIRQHSVSANAYEAPGEQDITADVNFTALSATAEQRGFEVQKLITQSQFLMGIGEANQFGDAFEACRLPQDRAKVALQLKHLLTPAGMGESFHVLVASKGVDTEKASELAGLSFGRK